MSEQTAHIIVGLGFGDEAKGATVDFFARQHKSVLNVKYSGGAQCAHTVFDQGKPFTFAQLGAGTFAGATTYLTKDFLVSLDNLKREYDACPVKPAKVHVDSSAILITPYHRALNLIHEDMVNEPQRGLTSNGTCGQGIGVTKEAFLNGASIPAAHIRADHKTIVDGLTKIREWVEYKFSLLASQYHLNDSQRRKYYLALRKNMPSIPEYALKLASFNKEKWLKLNFPRVPSDGGLEFYLDRVEELTDKSHIVFEGGQGIWLDQTLGTMPHVTWTDVTPRNAIEMCKAYGIKYTVVGCIRWYGTRHGNGPLMQVPCIMNEDAATQRQLAKKLLADAELHQSTTGPQGEFCTFFWDIAKVKEACELCEVDELAISHLDVGVGNPVCDKERDAFLKTVSNPAFGFPPVRLVARGPSAADREYGLFTNP